jgi:hypothetical protein
MFVPENAYAAAYAACDYSCQTTHNYSDFASNTVTYLGLPSAEIWHPLLFLPASNHLLSLRGA